jgi:hypothetical protein
MTSPKLNTEHKGRTAELYAHSNTLGSRFHGTHEGLAKACKRNRDINASINILNRATLGQRGSHMDKNIGYKWIKKDMTSAHGNLKWELGKWQKHDGGLSMCKAGFHACKTPLQSLEYIYGDRWFMVEYKGSIIKKDDKFVCTEMRLIKEIDVKKVMLPLACICARRSLKHFEDKYPKDDRPRKAIEAAETYIKNPTEKNRSAAESAESAAWSAAWSAESAARSAARSAAWSAESAAWSAAWSAAESAESAARSAESAARSAARSAAESAAESAARSAEKKWQNTELLKLIKCNQSRKPTTFIRGIRDCKDKKN